MLLEAYKYYHHVSLAAKTAAASPLELILILLENLIQELARARGHIVAKRIKEKGKSIDHCLNILNGLSIMLDTEAAGEITTGLAHLYDSAAHRLYRASFYLDETQIDEIISLLEVIQRGWNKINADKNA